MRALYPWTMRRFVQAIADLDVMPEGLPSSVAQALVDQPVRYNIGKGGTAAVIQRDAQGEAVVAPMRWGLIPRWSKQPSTPYTTITARLDRAASSRIFSQAWKQRPCLIPMTGYYKWDRQRRPPWPHFIQASDGLTLLAAGIWERWESATELIDSFSILTATNHAIPAPLTPDGPVFMGPGAAMDWIMGSCGTAEDLRRRAHHPALESYPVARKIRNPEVDDYTLLEPVDPDIEDDGTGASGHADEDEEEDMD
jgi:putative SOS response-associated peptidase YedK